MRPFAVKVRANHTKVTMKGSIWRQVSAAMKWSTAYDAPLGEATVAAVLQRCMTLLGRASTASFGRPRRTVWFSCMAHAISSCFTELPLGRGRLPQVGRRVGLRFEFRRYGFLDSLKSFGPKATQLHEKA